MQPLPIRGYRFAGFTLDLTRRRLSGHGQDSIVLSGRAFDVLAFLLACRDRMVTKRELMDTVWPRMVVEENNLTQAISTLRRVLGDSREAPQFIATIAGRGYQFVGDASPVTDFASELDSAPPVAPLPSSAPTLPPIPARETISQPVGAGSGFACRVAAHAARQRRCRGGRRCGGRGVVAAAEAHVAPACLHRGAAVQAAAFDLAQRGNRDRRGGIADQPVEHAARRRGETAEFGASLHCARAGSIAGGTRPRGRGRRRRLRADPAGQTCA